MGDMADFALEGVWDEDDLYLDYLAGNMTESEAYEFGFINEMGGLVGTEHEKFCKYCNAGGLHWGKLEGGGWRLIDENGNIHNCKQHPSNNSFGNKPIEEYEVRNATEMTEMCYPDKLTCEEFVEEIKDYIDGFSNNMNDCKIKLRYAEEWMQIFAAWMEMEVEEKKNV